MLARQFAGTGADVCALDMGMGINEADRRLRLLATRRRVELDQVHRVRDDTDVDIADVIFDRLLEVPRDGNFQIWQAQGAVHARRQLGVEPDFVALDQMHFAALAGGHGFHPERRFPPGGDDDVGIGNIVGCDGARALQHLVRHARQGDVPNVRNTVRLQRCPIPFQDGAHFLPRTQAVRRAVHNQHFMATGLQLLGINGDDACAAADVI